MSNTPHIVAVVILPEATSIGKARDAWTHAVRYTAKGLDIPDFDAALVMLKERHPSWTVIPSGCPLVPYDLKGASPDVPENS